MSEEPNIHITGDEARVLMQLLMTTPLMQLYNKLNIINTVQPAQTNQVETPNG